MSTEESFTVDAESFNVESIKIMSTEEIPFSYWRYHSDIGSSQLLHYPEYNPHFKHSSFTLKKVGVPYPMLMKSTMKYGEDVCIS